MLATRVIARLDIKPTLGVVKGVRMEGLRVVGDPHTLAAKYADQGADEILYLDITASLYGRPAIHELVTRTSRDVFVPLTVGGGLRTVRDVRRMLQAGADKVAINTAALASPVFITELARTFGSQCVVVSVEIKQTAPDRWLVYTEAGRTPGGREAVDWCREVQDRGAGEVLVTSVDFDGTQAGFDFEFLAKLHARMRVPVVVSGGCGSPLDVVRACSGQRGPTPAGIDAVAVGAWLHAGGTIGEIKQALAEAGVEVR